MHQRDPFAGSNHFVALIPGSVLEHDYAIERTGLALPLFKNSSFHVQRIACKNGLRESNFVPTEIAYGRAKCGVANRYANHQPQGKNAVHQRLAELGAFCIFGVKMDRRRIVGHGAEENVIGFGNRSPDVVPENLSHIKLLKIKSCHFSTFYLI